MMAVPSADWSVMTGSAIQLLNTLVENKKNKPISEQFLNMLRNLNGCIDAINTYSGFALDCKGHKEHFASKLATCTSIKVGGKCPEINFNCRSKEGCRVRDQYKRFHEESKEKLKEANRHVALQEKRYNLIISAIQKIFTQVN